MRTDRSQFDYKRKRDESIAVGLKPMSAVNGAKRNNLIIRPDIKSAPKGAFFLISEGGGRCELTGVSLTTSESETRVSRSA